MLARRFGAKPDKTAADVGYGTHLWQSIISPSRMASGAFLNSFALVLVLSHAGTYLEGKGNYTELYSAAASLFHSR